MTFTIIVSPPNGGAPIQIHNLKSEEGLGTPPTPSSVKSFRGHDFKKKLPNPLHEEKSHFVEKKESNQQQAETIEGIVTLVKGFFTLLKDSNEFLFLKVQLNNKEGIWVPLRFFIEADGQYKNTNDKIKIMIENKRFVFTCKHETDHEDFIEIIEKPNSNGPFTKSGTSQKPSRSFKHAIEKRVKVAFDQKAILQADLVFEKAAAKALQATEWLLFFKPDTLTLT